ncbi:MAG: hypothetical protein WCO56_01455 [Verrucomicrobiota bacterium]
MLSLCWFAIAAVAADQPVYENDFQKAGVGKVPDDLMVIEGSFAVKAEGADQFLELAEAPLDTFGALFGPSEVANLSVAARIYGTNTKRRFPTFGVGLNGVGGYRLQVAPAKGRLELFKGDVPVAFIAFAWESGNWTCFKLQSRKGADGSVTVEGKAWKQGAEEPKGWPLSFTDKEPPAAGRPAIWGSPFSTTPIRYDDLVVRKVE